MNISNPYLVKDQAGSVLLEGLFAILIFSMGILGIVGLQIASIKQSTDAKYRTEASLLANELIGKMWVTDRTQATLNTNFSSPDGTAYKAWLGISPTPASGTVQATLPGISVTTGTLPLVTVGANNDVTIQIFWKQPSDAATDPIHKYQVTATIK